MASCLLQVLQRRITISQKKFLLLAGGEEGVFTYQTLRCLGVDVSLCATNKWTELHREPLSRLSWSGDLVNPESLSIAKEDFHVCLSSGFQSIVPETFLNRSRMPKLNLHAALLPKFRGKHGGIWALIEDEEYMGVSLHHLTPELDNGPLVWQKRTRVPRWGPLSQIQKTLYRLLQETLENLVSGKISFDQQVVGIGPDQVWPVRKPHDSVIDWSKPPRTLFCFARALSRPGIYAFDFLESEALTFDRIIPTPMTHNISPGRVIGVSGPRSVLVSAGYGSVVEARLVGGRLGPEQIAGRTLASGMVSCAEEKFKG